MNKFVDNVVKFPRAKRPRPIPAAPPASPSAHQAKPSFLSYIAAGLWFVAAMLTPIISLPLGIWAFIELILMAFGRPAWHFFAVFGLLVALHVFVGTYRPKLPNR